MNYGLKVGADRDGDGIVGEWNKNKIGEFLFEGAGKYKPDAEEIVGLKHIDKIDFSGNFHIAQKPSKTNMILIK